MLRFILWIAATASPILLLVLYVRRNDRALRRLPPAVAALSPHRNTAKDAHDIARALAESPISVLDQLPPKTGRRYIVVGGAGFLGGWIVVQLLQRGEDPRRIRILDIRPPTRHDLTTGPATDVEFIKVDISDADAVTSAFNAPWPSSGADAPTPELTVFHTAANIRFYERHPALVPLSAKVNVHGTQNIINASRAAGASVLVYTSSGSVAVRRSRFFLWPWEREPPFFVQVLNDDDSLVPTRHDAFFSNYAATKIDAERRVRAADGTLAGARTLRTGCIRPGNGIFGPGGDMLCGAYLVREHNPSWIHSVLQSFVYVENCALAHLCYEARLIALGDNASGLPDIGGQAFMVTDPGPPPTYGDVYVHLSALAPATSFPALSPTAMLLVAHILERYYLARHFLRAAGSALARWLPPLDSDLVNLQPSLFALTMVHLVFDDSRARLPPERGGLGYRGGWTTLQALCKTVEEHKKALKGSDARSDAAGVSFGFGLVRAERGVDKIGEKVSEKVTQVLN